MAKLPRLTPQQAEKKLLKIGFEMIRSKGGHRIYMKGEKRIILPFHTVRILHPKIVKQVIKCIDDSS